MLVLFTHAWTWGILVSIVWLFFILSILKRSKKIVMVFTFLTLALSFLIISLMFFSRIKPIMFKEFLSGYQEILPSFSFLYLLKLNETLTKTLISYVGGFLINPALFILALIGLFRIKDLKNEFNRIIFSWISITSIIALLVSSWLQWRLFYLMPLPILAALGLNSMLEFINWLYAKIAIKESFQEGLEHAKTINKLFTILIILLMLNYAFRSIYYSFASPNIFWA